MKPFEKIERKGENAGNQHYLLFPQCFIPIPKRISVFELRLLVVSANASNLDQSKNVPFGRELTVAQMINLILEIENMLEMEKMLVTSI